MHLVMERDGRLTKEDSGLDRLAEGLYDHRAGRVLLRPLISPAVSKLSGLLLDSRMSRGLIRPFIKNNHIPMKDYEKKEYVSFNDFFTRRLAPGARPVREEPEVFVSPCDGRLSVCKIDGDQVFFIKNSRYTVQSLLRNRKLAERFVGGYVWVFRLCVDDYHRYIFVDEGKPSKSVRIPGVFHTVNPVANERFPIYQENTREYSLLRTKNFGTVLQMEVGAMLVGRIENRSVGSHVYRGQEKGNFAYGGSTVILMTRKGAVEPDGDILKNSRENMETKVRLGEKVGTAAGEN